MSPVMKPFLSVKIMQYSTQIEERNSPIFTIFEAKIFGLSQPFRPRARKVINMVKVKL